jgi:hypothetical protein
MISIWRSRIVMSFEISRAAETAASWIGLQGPVEISRAAETADRTLTPLTCSSALTAPCTQVTAGCLSKCLGELRVVREISLRHSQSQNITGRGTISAYGARQRFQRSVSGVSGRFCIAPYPKFREEPGFGVRLLERIGRRRPARCGQLTGHTSSWPPSIDPLATRRPSRNSPRSSSRLGALR